MMRCPTLAEIPLSFNKTGWPWTEESPQLPEKRDNVSYWPKISIVTPSYNQGQFIEATIRSILLQGYPNLEYIIIDGSSSDDTVEIIRKYEEYISYWVSEADNGQSEAINKGLKLCTGDIVAYLNSDDLYLPQTFVTVAEHLRMTNAPWLIGRCQYVETDGTFVRSWLPKAPGNDRAKWVYLPWVAPQASTFWTRGAIERVGYFSESMHYAFDSEYLLRLLLFGLKPTLIDVELAVRTLHKNSKTVSRPEEFGLESAHFADIFNDQLSYDEQRRVAAWFKIAQYGEYRQQQQLLEAVLVLLATLQKYPLSTLHILGEVWGPKIFSWLPMQKGTHS